MFPSGKGPRPERGVSYASMHPALTSHTRNEAVQGLAKFLGVTEARAAALLDDPVEYRAEIRSHQVSGAVSVEQARREMRRRDPIWRNVTVSDQAAILEAYRESPA